ncbi:hypothetical protein GQ607_012603, partial [Colletotrichum asianum]
IPRCGYDTRGRSRQLFQHPLTSDAWPHAPSCDRPASPDPGGLASFPLEASHSHAMQWRAPSNAAAGSTVCDRLVPQPSTSFPQVIHRFGCVEEVPPRCHCLGTPLSPAFTCRNGSRASKAPPNQRPPWPSPNTLTTQAANATTCLAGLFAKRTSFCKAGSFPPAKRTQQQTTFTRIASHRVLLPCRASTSTAADQLDPHYVPSTPSCDGSTFVT